MPVVDFTRHAGSPALYTPPEWPLQNCVVAVTSREGGVSAGPYESFNLGAHVGDNPAAVAANALMLSGAFRGEAIAFVSQVHGATVVEAETIDSRTEADAIMLRRGAAGVRVADCVPIAIVDPVQHAAVIIHAGWRGHAAGVIEAAAAQLGGQASDWLAVVGPSISGAAYQVGHDVIDADSRFFSFATPDSEGKFLLDLRALTRSTLADLGVDDERQWISSQVTDGGKTFFSDRAQRPCGRFAMIVSWQS